MNSLIKAGTYHVSGSIYCNKWSIRLMLFTAFFRTHPPSRNWPWKSMKVHGRSWNFLVKSMDFHVSPCRMLRFNDMEVHRLPCESIIGHQWQWAIRLGKTKYMNTSIHCKQEFSEFIRAGVMFWTQYSRIWYIRPLVLYKDERYKDKSWLESQL